MPSALYIAISPLIEAIAFLEFPHDGAADKTEEVMRIGCPLVAISILCLMPSASMAQEAQPYVKNQTKVDWGRGTDFSKYKTYAGATCKR